MAITITVAGKLTDQRILAFPTEILEDYVVDDYVVDASALTFVEPMGIVQLILLVQHVVRIGLGVTFIAPNGYEPDHYMARMGFYEHVPEGVILQNAIDRSSVRRRESCDALIPVTGFRSNDDVEDLFVNVTRFLQRMMLERLIPRELYSSLSAAVPELAGNAAEHARSHCGGLIAGQIYRTGGYLAVGDLGIGIRQHLARNPRWSDMGSDEEAIKRAMERGVSGASDDRGQGYDYVLDELEQTKGAELFVRSGAGWVRTSVTGKVRKAMSGTDLCGRYPGTIIELVVRP